MADQPTLGQRIRCGDKVRNKNRGEYWVVAYADYEQDRLSWFGWPEGSVAIGDVELVRSCTDEEHSRAVAEWLDRSSGRERDHRPSYIRRLYRPDEHRRMLREDRERRITELETELCRLRQEQADDR